MSHWSYNEVKHLEMRLSSKLFIKTDLNCITCIVLQDKQWEMPCAGRRLCEGRTQRNLKMLAMMVNFMSTL